MDGQTINPASITAVQSVSTNCSQMASYPAAFKTASGAIAIKKTPSADYTVTFPNHQSDAPGPGKLLWVCSTEKYKYYITESPHRYWG